MLIFQFEIVDTILDFFDAPLGFTGIDSSSLLYQWCSFREF